MKKIIFIFIYIMFSYSSFPLLSQDFTKRILVEEFTGEGCVNCPRVASYIQTSIKEEEFADNVVIVCHHSGYHKDWLTTDFDEEYTWFYNTESTFAPGIMVDRNAGTDQSPVIKISSPSMMEDFWRDALIVEAPVSVNISAEHMKKDKLVHVRVTGTKNNSLWTIENPVITVFLVENEIEAINQMGATEGYMHQHVGRAVNSVWGTPLNFTGDSYVYDCEFKLSPQWDANNMYVVAFISNYNSENPNDCRVANTSQLFFRDFSGLTSVSDVMEKDEIEEIFTLSGIKIPSNHLSPGIYIIKQGPSLRKVIIRT